MKEEEYLSEVNKILEELENDLLEKDTGVVLKKALARIRILSKRMLDESLQSTVTGKVIEHLRYIFAYLIGYVR